MLESTPMADFFERLGHKTVQSESSLWYEVQADVLLAIPYHKLIEPSEEEISELMDSNGLRAIRYPTTLHSFGFLSNITVNTNRHYDLADLHQKARNQTRRGLENCAIEQIGFDYLMKSGLPLNMDTAERQGRESVYADPAYWRKYCEAAAGTEGVTAWGAFVDGQLAVFLIAVEAGNDWIEWIVNHSLTAFRSKYPNNALAFTAARHFFQEKKCNGICYGLGSLEDTTQLDHFKERMGWTIQPIRQRLIFSKRLRIASLLAQEPCLKIINSIFPKSYKVRKASAMIRLYRQQSFEISGCER